MKEQMPPPFVNRDFNKPQGGRKAERIKKIILFTILICAVLPLLIYNFFGPFPEKLNPVELTKPGELLPASYSATFEFTKEGSLKVFEKIIVNNTNAKLTHGIARRIPNVMPLSDADLANVELTLDTQINNKALLKDDIKVAGLTEKSSSKTENNFTLYFIGGENLELSNEIYTFVFEYEIKNIKEVFQHGASFRWRVPDFTTLVASGIQLRFLFQPFVESKHIDFSAKHLKISIFENGEEKIEELDDLSVSKIFPANNQSQRIREQEIVETTVSATSEFYPNEFIEIKVKIPREYFL